MALLLTCCSRGGGGIRCRVGGSTERASLVVSHHRGLSQSLPRGRLDHAKTQFFFYIIIIIVK
jgi:hypothetical protein